MSHVLNRPAGQPVARRQTLIRSSGGTLLILLRRRRLWPLARWIGGRSPRLISYQDFRPILIFGPMCSIHGGSKDG